MLVILQENYSWMKDGKLERNAIGRPAGVTRPGYPKEFLEEYVKQTGDRYKIPE